MADLGVRFNKVMSPDLSKLRVLAEQVFAFRATLTPESDRGCALMAAAFLDNRLEFLIESSLLPEPKLIKAFLSFNGPAGTFSARIDYAYLTAMLSKSVHSDLHLIRKIRNEFGHRIEPINFNTPEIKQRCDEFHNIIVPAEASPRHKFTNACMGVLRSIDIAIICQVSPKAKEECLISAEEREALLTDFDAKFNSALSELSEEEILADPIAAKKRIFAAVIVDPFK